MQSMYNVRFLFTTCFKKYVVSFVVYKDNLFTRNESLTSLSSVFMKSTNAFYDLCEAKILASSANNKCSRGAGRGRSFMKMRKGRGQGPYCCQPLVRKGQKFVTMTQSYNFGHM